MTLFIFLTVLQTVVAAVLVILVLMQRSEGGGLGVGGGGSPGGFMSARGAADFLTRATKWTAVLFVALAIVLAGIGVNATGTRAYDESLDRSVTQRNLPAAAPAEAAPAEGEGAPESAPADDPLSAIPE